ncbi:MAG: MgtC/SapB transporter [Ramlibacter sp.]|jgi:putative Mg2+ transporter-C (MgtC) family protein|uniref:MgtC/SapB family protein n=1 Tax=Ramlibacter sp. TaxID=1917967 RepID=UPI00260D286D|nr:MgtC/SapB family protein [Ramlibacter sp.]MDB5752073.1 MgtC/SapB transporter [Ramlibacter sp.]
MSAWDTITATIASEFSDIGDLEQLTRLVLRLVLAALLGGMLGLQRERQGKEAGIRTHMLVAAGSALFVLVPLQTGMDEEGVSRVLQGLLAGIGFLCAGTILKLPSEEHVRGLTTAAGIWMTAAIGMACGLGRETTAVISTLLVLAILALERPFRRLGLRKNAQSPES